MCGNVLLRSNRREQRRSRKANFYGFVKPIEYMHVLEKVIQENSVQTCTNLWCGAVCYYRISQNHRLGEVGRDLWRSWFSSSLLKQGYLEPAVWPCLHGFWIASRTETPQFPGQSVLCEHLVTLTVKTCRWFSCLSCGWKWFPESVLVLPHQELRWGRTVCDSLGPSCPSRRLEQHLLSSSPHALLCHCDGSNTINIKYINLCCATK